MSRPAMADRPKPGAEQVRFDTVTLHPFTRDGQGLVFAFNFAHGQANRPPRRDHLSLAILNFRTVWAREPVVHCGLWVVP